MEQALAHARVILELLEMTLWPESISPTLQTNQDRFYKKLISIEISKNDYYSTRPHKFSQTNAYRKSLFFYMN